METTYHQLSEAVGDLSYIISAIIIHKPMGVFGNNAQFLDIIADNSRGVSLPE